MNKAFVLVICLLLTLTTKAQDYSIVRTKLEAISDSAIIVRKNVMPVIRKYGANSIQMDSINALILHFDSTSLVIVSEIIDKHGWLGTSQIGEKANGALYLTIQHAQDNYLREKYYPFLQASAKRGESRLADMSTMKDRILVEKGGKQLYGTQYKYIDGQRVLLPVKNINGLNKRRIKVGLEEIKLPQPTL
jgi:hypothetical protein